MADLFTWVGDASPWLWLALGIALLALEILAPSFVVVWPGLAAFLMALLTWLAPALSGETLVAAFSVLSIALLFGGRALMAKVEQSEPQTMLNARGKNMVGREAKVLSVNGPSGTVEIDGVQWPATWDGEAIPEIDQWVRVTKSLGVNLHAEAK